MGVRVVVGGPALPSASDKAALSSAETSGEQKTGADERGRQHNRGFVGLSGAGYEVPAKVVTSG